MTTPIKVAILDDYPNIAPPHFASLESQFTFTSFPNTLPPYNHASTTTEQKRELVERLKSFAVISSMRERTPFPEGLLRELAGGKGALKLLLTTGMRNLGIDLEAARDLGVDVLGTKGENPPGMVERKRKGPDSTTQHCIALLLALSKNLIPDHNSIQSGGWQTGLSTGLSGKTLGLLGLGRLGVAVGKIMSQSFGMRVWAWSEHLMQEAADEKAKAAGLPVEDEDGEKTFKVVSKEDLFRRSDVVSLHYVLSERSRGIVSLEDLQLMKKSALFINTSRGPLVDENSLLDVLDNGGIRGAALDVFELEPLRGDSRWRTTRWGEEGRSQVLLSPHTGYVEEETMNGWYWEQARVLEAWGKTGERRNLMN